MGNTTGLNTTDLNTNSTEQTTNSTDLTSESPLPGHGDNSEIVPKELEKILSDRARMTRIVNGEDCPPGECPWQVETLYFK